MQNGSVLLVFFLLILPLGAAALPADEGVPSGLLAASSDRAPVETPSVETEDGPAPVGGLEGIIAAAEEDLGIDASDRSAPAGLRGLARLAAQPAEEPGNQTEDGIVSHRHNGVGGDGLDIVWESAFLGVPYLLETGDVDGDGEDEVIAGTEIGVVVVDDEGVEWTYGVGSDLTSLFLMDADSDGEPEIGFSTIWGSQQARVAVLDGDGQLLWEYTASNTIIDAGPAGDGSGDVLAVDIAGRHMRISSAGDERWSRDVDIIDSTGTGAVVAYAYVFNYGHYLGDVGDLNGDGVADTVSANLVNARAYVFGVGTVGTSPEEYVTLIHATDGATGDPLWTGYGPSAPSNFFGYQFLIDLELLDANGDGALDVATSHYGFNYYYAATLVSTYNTGFRVYDGASSDVADVIGAREIVTPQLPLAYYSLLEHTDADGDGMDELVVLHSGTVAGAVHGATSVLERYQMPNGPGSDPAMVAVGEAFPLAGDYLETVSGIDRDDGRYTTVSLFDERTSEGLYQEISPAGETVNEARFKGTLVLASTAWDGDMAYAVFEGVIRPADSGDDLVPFHGAPYVVANGDQNGDGTLDILALSSDGNIHVRDGLTGDQLTSFDEELPIQALVILREDPLLMVVESITQEEDTAFYKTDLRAIDRNGTEIWKMPETYVPSIGGHRGVILDGDGDGVQDLVTEFSNDWGDGEYSVDIQLTSGATGEPLWTTSVPVAGSVYPDDLVVASINGGDDLVFVDGWEGIYAVDGATGDRILSQDFDDNWYRSCLGAYDPDGDGQDDVVLIIAGYDTLQTYVYTNGSSEKLPNFLPINDDLRSCGMERVPRTDGGDDLAVTWTVWDEAGSGGLGVYRDGEDALLWTKSRGSISESRSIMQILGVDATGDGPARILATREDHVFLYDAGSGDQIGAFTFNGPWVATAEFIDLDDVGYQEIAAVSRDGVLRAISDESEVVQEAIVEKVELAGIDEGKNTPAPAPALVLVALAAIAAILRRRH